MVFSDQSTCLNARPGRHINTAQVGACAHFVQFSFSFNKTLATVFFGNLILNNLSRMLDVFTPVLRHLEVREAPSQYFKVGLPGMHSTVCTAFEGT